MPTVDRILPCRGGKSVNVLLSDGKRVRISRAKLAALHLETGKDAPAALLRLQEESLTPEKARDTAARIAMRPVFSAEVRDKLLARGFSPENAEDAVRNIDKEIDEVKQLRNALLSLPRQKKSWNN